MRGPFSSILGFVLAAGVGSLAAGLPAPDAAAGAPAGKPARPAAKPKKPPRRGPRPPAPRRHGDGAVARAVTVGWTTARLLADLGEPSSRFDDHWVYDYGPDTGPQTTYRFTITAGVVTKIHVSSVACRMLRPLADIDGGTRVRSGGARAAHWTLY